jgi:CHAT domain-containing protein
MEASRDFNNAVNNSKDSSLINLYSELKSLRKYSSKLTSEGSDKQALISNINNQADSLDQVLSRKMSSYADYKKNFSLTWKDVQANLLSDEASIEFTRYYDEKDSAYHYMALIVKTNDKYPLLIKLCSEDELKKLSPEKELNELYSLLWKPISNQLTGIKTIYYTPAGIMNNIPFHALYEEKSEGREYLLDKYSLNQLTSTRYLALGLKKKSQEPIKTDIALFGGVNYNDFPEINLDTSNYVASDAAFLYKNIMASRDLEDTRSGASYLPGTKKEVEGIAELLTSNKWDVFVSEGKNASEEKIKNFSGKNSKSILHIATHGFAFSDKSTKQKKEIFEPQNGNEKYKISDNPMIRSGLLFSGANMTWQGKGDSLLKITNEDAVLTAYELSQLDLSNTKLVVLSACETGKGAIQGSEGTFGLKRALKLAGVDNMIVSLWKVPDDATMEMMTLFYTELLKSKNPVMSFETAQKAMRLKYPTEPKKWAGFVFVR